MTTNKLQISGHPMGQELELPRPNLTEITKDNARQETTAEVPFSEKIHMGQH